MAASSADDDFPQSPGVQETSSITPTNIQDYGQYVRRMKEFLAFRQRELRKALDAYAKHTKKHEKIVFNKTGGRYGWAPNNPDQSREVIRDLVAENERYKDDTDEKLEAVKAAERAYISAYNAHETAKAKFTRIVQQRHTRFYADLVGEISRRDREKHAADNMERLRAKELGMVNESQDLWGYGGDYDGQDLAYFAISKMRKAVMADQNAINSADNIGNWKYQASKSKIREIEADRFMELAKRIRATHSSQIQEVLSEARSIMTEAREHIRRLRDLHLRNQPTLLARPKQLLNAIDKSTDFAYRTIRTLIRAIFEEGNEFLADDGGAYYDNRDDRYRRAKAENVRARLELEQLSALYT
jgi:hypothetical protein